MASYTPNYNLKKPADSDSYDIADHNGNMDKIDTALNTLNGNKANLIKISDNSDLNDLRITGLYKSPSTVASVGTLSNCPVSVPFVMSVSGNDSTGGSTVGVVQLVATGDGLYVRRGTSSGFDSGWIKYVSSSELNDFIKTKDATSESITVAGNTTGNTTISLSLTGYTLIGVIEITGSGTSGLAYSDFYVVSGGIRVYYKNTTSSSKTFTLKVTGLFKKN